MRSGVQCIWSAARRAPGDLLGTIERQAQRMEFEVMSDHVHALEEVRPQDGIGS